MRIIERYVFREVLQAWLAVTLVLLIILLSNQLASVLSRVASSGFSSTVVLSLLWLSSLQQLVVLIPIGLFLAIMLALGRLYHESELAAMQACGISNKDLLKPVLLLAIFAAGLLAWLVLIVAPQSGQRELDLRGQAMREARFASLQPGKFRSFAGSNIVFYAESVDEQNVLHNVYAERARPGGMMEIVTAKRAEQRGVGEAEQTFILYDGDRYEGVPGSKEFRIIHFAEHGIPVRLPEVATGTVKTWMKSTGNLLRSDAKADQAELQARLSSPLVVLVLAVLAVPLARLKPRQGRYARAGYFILAYLIYFFLLQSAQTWMERGTTPAWLGMWWVHAVAMVLVAFEWWRVTAMGWSLRRVVTR
jgi:lipopolysaccharide export system permease protein